MKKPQGRPKLPYKSVRMYVPEPIEKDVQLLCDEYKENVLPQSIEDMKIYQRIMDGSLKGYTIRKSKKGWYNLYSNDGVSVTKGINTYQEVVSAIKSFQDSDTIIFDWDANL